MLETKSQRMVGALDAFLATSPDVEAAAVVSFDGLTMASALPDGMEEDRVGAMSAALLSLGEQAAQGLGRGELSQLFVEAEGGFVFLMSARDQAVLVAVAGRHAKIGLMLFEMRRAADEVGALLEGGPAAHGAGLAPAPEPGSETPPAPAGLAEGPEAAAEPGRGPGPGPEGQAPSDPAGVAAAAVLASDGPEPFAGVSDRPAGLRDPFGDPDLDDPHYVSATGRDRDGAQHRV